jgi:hypothetical protein
MAYYSIAVGGPIPVASHKRNGVSNKSLSSPKLLKTTVCNVVIKLRHQCRKDSVDSSSSIHVLPGGTGIIGVTLQEGKADTLDVMKPQIKYEIQLHQFLHSFSCCIIFSFFPILNLFV